MATTHEMEAAALDAITEASKAAAAFFKKINEKNGMNGANVGPADVNAMAGVLEKAALLVTALKDK